MNPRRLLLVKQAFEKIDKDGSGLLDASDVCGAYDASKHPEVIAGRMNAEQVFREFLNNFDVGGVQDGKVTPGEWVNYYNAVSASIVSDDYFELLIRNAWHLSGGEGWAANNSNSSNHQQRAPQQGVSGAHGSAGQRPVLHEPTLQGMVHMQAKSSTGQPGPQPSLQGSNFAPGGHGLAGGGSFPPTQGQGQGPGQGYGHGQGHKVKQVKGTAAA